MASSTDTPNIYTLFSKCTSTFDALINEAKHQSNKLKQSFPSEAAISSSRQDFCQWGKSYGANLGPASTISLDYKFRNKEYTRTTVQSHLGHLLDDLEGLQKLYTGETKQGDATVIFVRVESVVSELKRFMGHLPKELWLDLKRWELVV
ncbi:hypothetical protein HG530_006163 [Fusarium avenaceum]|nr:hypothetical protein DER45DRAFT_639105 [Fusarium avenaceum]KAI6768154.1 hypothetical protein HG530_006163 [Fusarium avenaceum]